MCPKPSVNSLNNASSVSKEIDVGYHTTKGSELGDNGSKPQHLPKGSPHIPTRTRKDQLVRARRLAYLREHKFKGALQRMITDALDIGLTAIEKDLSKQHQTSSYAISGRGEYRADKVEKLMKIKNEFYVWNTKTSRSNYPFFHLNVIHNVVKKVLPVGTDPRTHQAYFDIITDLGKETESTSLFDLTGFMEHRFVN